MKSEFIDWYPDRENLNNIPISPKYELILQERL